MHTVGPNFRCSHRLPRKRNKQIEAPRHIVFFLFVLLKLHVDQENIKGSKHMPRCIGCAFELFCLAIARWENHTYRKRLKTVGNVTDEKEQCFVFCDTVPSQKVVETGTPEQRRAKQPIRQSLVSRLDALVRSGDRSAWLCNSVHFTVWNSTLSNSHLSGA